MSSHRDAVAQAMGRFSARGDSDSVTLAMALLDVYERIERLPADIWNATMIVAGDPDGEHVELRADDKVVYRSGDGNIVRTWPRDRARPNFVMDEDGTVLAPDIPPPSGLAGNEPPQASIAAMEVVKAWTEPGPVPYHHERIKRQLQAQWPTLSRAIEKLVRDARG